MDVFYVTINDHVLGHNVDQIKILGTLSCLVGETSSTPAGHPFDIGAHSGKAVVTFNNNAKVGIYSTSTHAWTYDDWTTECSGCVGHGIDIVFSTGDYYAAMRTNSGTSKIVKGTF